MTTSTAEKLTKDIQKSVAENVQSAFSESIEMMKQQIDENRSAVKDLGKQFPDSQELQQLIQQIEEAYSSIEGALEDTKSAAEPQQGQGGGNGQVSPEQLAEQLIGQPVQGSKVLGEKDNEQGQKVQRLVDDSGNLIEATLNESGEIENEDIVGNVAELEAQEEFTNDTGQTVRRARDESGSIVEVILDEENKPLVVGLIEEAASKGSQEQQQQGDGQEEQEEPEITSAARKKADEMGVDISSLQGSGSGGRITLKDVQQAGGG